MTPAAHTHTSGDRIAWANRGQEAFGTVVEDYSGFDGRFVKVDADGFYGVPLYIPRDSVTWTSAVGAFTTIN